MDSRTAAIVAERQRVNLARAREHPHTATPAWPSCWAHVSLADLFEKSGNVVHHRGDGRAECGHEPHHASKSGGCVLLDSATGRWWCRSCGQRGDAATFVTSLHGWTYRQAAAWLTQHYGAPVGDGRTTRKAPRRRGEIMWIVL